MAVATGESPPTDKKRRRMNPTTQDGDAGLDPPEIAMAYDVKELKAHKEASGIVVDVQNWDLATLLVPV